MRQFFFVLFAILALGLPRMSDAHALDPGYLDLASLGNESWRVTWRKPDVSGQPMPIEARLPENCAYELPPSPVFDGRAWASVWIATCPGGLQGGEIEITGLDRTQTETLVRYELEPGETQVHRLTSTETAFIIPEDPGLRGIMSSYIWLGVTHMRRRHRCSAAHVTKPVIENADQPKIRNRAFAADSFNMNDADQAVIRR